ncbi:MAG TPA: hypothetical protein VMD09_07030 [Solirubrobacteraceae bacterium]|nr:hypothetical protein [Solirubrobacteraceae bacterium]
MIAWNYTFAVPPSGPLTRLARRAAASAARPVGEAMSGAFHTSLMLERRALGRLLENGEMDSLLADSLGSPEFELALRRVGDSPTTRRLIKAFFETGIFDEVITQLLESPALWRLVDEVAASPAVRAAVMHQSRGFADLIAEQVRSRSRNADDRIEDAARRLTFRPQRVRPGGGPVANVDLS